MRALLPVARLRAERRGYAILNEDAKTVVRLYAEHGRLTATAVKGYEAELDRVRETLALEEATVPLVDEAIVADGGDPAGISSKLALTLDPEEPANVAAARVFKRLLEVIDLNLPGTLDDVDSEFLHDLRVAVRRSRSLQRQFKAIYPERLQHHRDEFKRLQAVTGDLRDLDVYLLDFPDLQASLPEKMRADLDPLRGVLETRRARALTATRRALRAQRTGDALADWSEFVTAQHAVGPHGEGPRLAPDHAGLPQDGQDGLARSTTTRPPRTCTSCARWARSCATCSSSSPASTRRTSSSRS